MNNKFRRFSEYLTSTGKLDKPKVDASADTGPAGDKAPKAPATKGKGWEAQVKGTGKPVAYSNATKPVGKDFSEHPKGEKDGEAFTKKGDKKLVYEPKTPKDFAKEGGTKVASWPKTTKEFLDTTKGMKLSEFAEFLSDRNKINTPNVMPVIVDDPTIATHYVSSLAAANPGIMETFVREVKRLGCLDSLVGEIFKHNEAVSEIAHAISEDVVLFRKLERALNETRVQEVVDGPASETEEGGSKARKNPKSLGGENVDLKGNGSDILSTKSKMKKK